MSRDSMVRVALDTLDIISVGHYVNPKGVRVPIDLKTMMDGQALHPPGSVTPPNVPSTNIEVTAESSLQACRRLGDGVSLLAFSSARHPGGGFLSGAQAQEESIARSSGLYTSLMASSVYYKANKGATTLYTDTAVWSPHVPIFKDDAGRHLDKPHYADVLTIPAPNAHAWLRGGGSPSELADCLQRRLGVMFSLFTVHGAQNLVLGAWGCGVFGNDPEVMAWAFKVALKNWPFERVTFAIYGGGEVENIFRRVLVNPT